MNIINIFNQKAQDKMTSWGLLIMRLVFGFSMLYAHGLGKWTRFFGDDPIKFADPFGLGPTASLGLAMSLQKSFVLF